jgi:hypothetical protein
MVERFVTGSLSLDAVGRLAAWIALYARRGDTILLFGDLGAGKTELSRAIVRAIAANPGLEVASPTFPLLQVYDTRRFRVSHFDLYRLKGDDLGEIDLEGCLRDGIAIVEWPDRAPSFRPATRLEITLGDGSSEVERNLKLVAFGGWQARFSRLREAADFLVRCGAADAIPSYLQGDASTRTYARVQRDGRPLVLMDAPRQPDGPPVRDGLPYSRIARLAESVRPFVAIGEWLRLQGVSAPEIVAHDLDRGFLLIEDLGDRVFGREVAAGPARQRELWRAAVDVLLHLRCVEVPALLPLADGTAHALPSFDRAALEVETELLLDWYWPAVKGMPAPAEVRAEFAALWSPVLDRLLSLPKGLFLRDFHSPNLLWLPERHGIRRVGVIDFQDALKESNAFDLVSLLQDARVDVPVRLERDLFQYYVTEACRHDAAFDATGFAEAYALFGAQRNTRLVGLWMRLLKRDGKPQYLAHMPRTWDYLARNLAHPALAELKLWYDRHLPPEIRARAVAG